MPRLDRLDSTHISPGCPTNQAVDMSPLRFEIDFPMILWSLSPVESTPAADRPKVRAATIEILASEQLQTPHNDELLSCYKAQRRQFMAKHYIDTRMIASE